MKHLRHPIFKLFLGIIGLALCILFYFYSIGAFNPPPAVGYIHSAQDMPYLDLEGLKSALAEKSIPFYEEDAENSYPQAASDLIKQGAEVLIVSQDTNDTDQALVDLARQHGITLLFIGRTPSDDILTSYDKAWYVGSSAALGGELLGKQVADAFEQGVITDANGDHLLQYVTYLSHSEPYYQQLVEHTIQECEHYGVFSNQLTYQDKDGNPLEFTADQLSGQQKPELLLCSTAEDAQAMHQLAQQLGWLDGDAPVRIATVAKDKASAETLLSDGTCFAASYYDPSAVSQTLVQLACNSLNEVYIAQDCPLQPDETSHFFVPFQLVTSLENQS